VPALPLWLLVLLLCAGAVLADTQVAPPACDIRPATQALDGGVVHYSRAGSGPAVLLVHGLFAQKEQWDAVLCALADAGFTAVAPDLPGFGASTDFPITDYDLGRQVDLLHQFVGALGLGELNLVGNSMGGTIAALYAERYPHGLRRLAFVGAPLGVVEWGPRLRQAIEQGVNPFIPIDRDQFELELSLLFAHPPQVPDGVRDALIRDYVDRNRHYQQVWDIVNLYDSALAKLPRVAVPVLILWGESDGVYAVAGAPALRKRLPGSTLVTLPEAGHLPMVERPAETAALLIRFLRAGR
jgi:pimeloyl-ACP methyl ester carboxylesterase